jgi:glycosyltransferase involved in cell wall biosynthesis
VLRVAYTLEQCWHRVPGGTATAALEVARLLIADPDIDLRPLAGRHRRPPEDPWRPDFEVAPLWFGRPLLYETWLRLGMPKVERATGEVDVCHATGLVPAPSRAPLVVTVHDLAFIRFPEMFTAHGVKVMKRSLDRIIERAAMVICPSDQTARDLLEVGLAADRIAVVPLGVRARPVSIEEVAGVRSELGLGDRPFALFVGTIEPRKNLVRLVRALASMESRLPLVVAGADGWGAERSELAAVVDDDDLEVRFVGLVSEAKLAALYAAAEVFAYPSEWEGFGLPVLEAMAYQTPVVTSRNTSTAEVAGGAAVLVDPFDVDSIAAGLAEALDPDRRVGLIAAGLARVERRSWEMTAAATVEVYRQVAT